MSARDTALQQLTDASRDVRMRTLVRLCDKLEGDDACWLWNGARDKDGYGVFQLDRKTTQRAIRVMFALTHERLPNGVVRHTCDTPACARPEHLVDGTPQQNTQDMIRRRRKASTAGAQNGNAKLTVESVQQIRDRYAAGGVTYKQLALEFGVDRAQVNHIVLGTRWAS